MYQPGITSTDNRILGRVNVVERSLQLLFKNIRYRCLVKIIKLGVKSGTLNEMDWRAPALESGMNLVFILVLALPRTFRDFVRHVFCGSSRWVVFAPLAKLF